MAACLNWRGLILFVAALAGAWRGPAHVHAVEFYADHKIEIVIGFTAGGGFDLYGRLVARHLGEHLPGNPVVTPRNMTGAGSLIAASYIADVAPRDGTVIGIVDQSIPVEQALGDARIKFDSRRFTWIGNANEDNNIIPVWHTAPVKSIDDAKRIEIAMGSTGYNPSSQYVAALNTMIGTKFRLVFGYPGGAEINLAMERGEVAGRGSDSWTSLKSAKPEWIRDRMVNIIAQIGLQRAPDLPDPPLLLELATNDLDRAALRLLSAPTRIGRPFFGPPGMSPDRLAQLRAAFDEMMRDRRFLDDAKTSGLDVNPVSGAELAKIVDDIIDAPIEVRNRLANVLATAAREH